MWNRIPQLPLLIALATIAFQICQYWRSEQQHRSDAEETKWREAVTVVASASGSTSRDLAAALPVLKSDRFRGKAEPEVRGYLSYGTDRNFFTSLFYAFFSSAKDRQLPDLLEIDHAIGGRSREAWDHAWNARTKKDDLSKLKPAELVIYHYGLTAFPAITAEVGAILKRGTHREVPDLSNMSFNSGDWRGVNFGGANLRNARFILMDLGDADLSRIGDFSSVNFGSTAWWEAKSINKDLLLYLKSNYPFQPAEKGQVTKYGPRGETYTREQYEDAIVRLSPNRTMVLNNRTVIVKRK